MKLKLDENLGNRGARVLREAGHDVATVFEQGLTSAADLRVIEVCRQESRGLVTLDWDFGNPLLFNPAEYWGIAVLRLPPKASAGQLLDAIQTLATGLSRADLAGKLWIVQPGRIRVYQPDTDE